MGDCSQLAISSTANSNKIRFMSQQPLIHLALFGILQLTLGKALLNSNLKHR